MGLKIEQSNLEKVVSSSRGGDLQGLSQRSDTSSLSNQTEPPKKYEELIIALESDVRKHIRIEQQLKLHMESIEYTNEELQT